MLESLGPVYVGAVAVCTVLALWAAFAALARLRRGAPFGAVARLLHAALFGLLALVLVTVGVELRSYQRLTYEQPAATLTFRQVAPRYWAVDLETADGGFRALDLRGDAWQLDARIVKWSGVGLVLGLDTRFRLERLSGRYADLELERSAPRTVHALGTEPRWVDLWGFVQAHRAWLPFVDATYGSAAYLPAADGARFEVRVAASGLVARPANPAAERAVAAWR